MADAHTQTQARAELGSSARERVKVVFIVAWGRSGSTILDNALGEVDGFFSAGEIRYLWERGVARGWRCGCGRPVAECPIWSAVLVDLAGERDGIGAHAAAVLRAQDRFARIRHTWKLLRARGSARDPELDRYARTLGRLFRGVAAATGAAVVVDSSKRPSDAAMLRLVDAVDVYLVHLVRDPRAVAHSWSKRNSKVGRHGVVASTVNWLVWNLAAEAVRRQLPDKSVFVRYEDFVARPGQVLRRVLDACRETQRRPPRLEESRLHLGTNHTVSGNPSRFRTGAVVLRADHRWRDEIGTVRWWVATILALPLLRRYGYGMRRSRGHVEAPGDGLDRNLS